MTSRRTRLPLVLGAIGALLAACSDSNLGSTEPSSQLPVTPTDATHPTSTAASPPPTLPEAPTAPTEAVVRRVALEVASGFARGSIDWTAEPTSVSIGASLGTAALTLAFDGVPIATPTPMIAVDAAGLARATLPPDIASAGWNVLRDVEEAARPTTAEVAALVESTLGLADTRLLSRADVWVPIGTELRRGESWEVESPDGAQRFRVVVDLMTMTTADVMPFRVSADADGCPQPDSVPPPAACVGSPDPDSATADAALSLLEDDHELSGRYVRVVRGPRSLAGVDLGALTDTFHQDDGLWGGDSASPESAAANIYYWTTQTAILVDALGHPTLTQPAINVGVAATTIGDNVATTRLNLDIWHGPLGDGQSGADAQVVTHEYGHVLLARAAPNAWMTLLPGPAAYHEVAADMVAWTMTLPLDLDDPACLAPYAAARTRHPGPCIRRLDDDTLDPSAEAHLAGNSLRAAFYQVLVDQVQRAGESIDECLPGSWCELYAHAFLATLIESWPMLNRSDFTLADAATAFVVANEALGYFDDDLVVQAFEDHPGTAPFRVTVTVAVQHPDPSALSVDFDVIDAGGRTICTIAAEVPGQPTLTVDASACFQYLPADRDRIWRATVTSAAGTPDGRLLEFAITDDGAVTSVHPAAAAIGGSQGNSLTVTIPSGVEVQAGLRHIDGVVAGSDVGIDEEAGVVVVVDIHRPSLQAFDLETGRLRWTGPYSYGTAYRGITARFVMIDHLVVAIAPDGNDNTGVVAYDASSGQPAWFAPIDSPFLLQTCGAQSVCVTHGDAGTRTRLSTVDGRQLGDLSSGEDELPIASIGDDLVSMTEGSTPQVRRWNPLTGATVWTETPAPGVAAETSGGWNTTYRPELGIYIISIGPSSDLFGGHNGYTAALDPATGRTLWSREGTWLLPGLPDTAVYLLTYDTGFGLSGSATGKEIIRVDPLNGRILATLNPGRDPLQLTFLFDASGTTAWWRDDSGVVLGGRNMLTDVPVEGGDAVGWEVVPRDALQSEGQSRSMPAGFQAVWIVDGSTLATSSVPAWIGARTDNWFAYVAPDGTVVIGRTG